MAKRKSGPHLLMANRLTDGRVVFFGGDESWHADHTQAALAEGAALDALEAAGRAFEANNTVIDLQVVPADATGPSHIKQRIQASGPTVRLDLGRQANNG